MNCNELTTVAPLVYIYNDVKLVTVFDEIFALLGIPVIDVVGYYILFCSNGTLSTRVYMNTVLHTFDELHYITFHYSEGSRSKRN